MEDVASAVCLLLHFIFYVFLHKFARSLYHVATRSRNYFQPVSSYINK